MASDTCIDTDGRSPARTSKDLHGQSEPRTSSLKGLHQQANEVADFPRVLDHGSDDFANLEDSKRDLRVHVPRKRCG
jgi:hypothetical protein